MRDHHRRHSIAAIFCAIISSQTFVDESSCAVLYDGRNGDANPLSQGWDLVNVTGTPTITPDPVNDWVSISTDAGENWDYRYPNRPLINSFVADGRYSWSLEVQVANPSLHQFGEFDLITGFGDSGSGFRERIFIEPNRFRLKSESADFTPLFGDIIFTPGETPNFVSMSAMNKITFVRDVAHVSVYVNEDLIFEGTGGFSSLGPDPQVNLLDNAAQAVNVHWQSLSIENPPAPPGGKLFVRARPFLVSGFTDATPLSSADVDTYLNAWNASSVDVYSNSTANILNHWEPEGVPWVKLVTPGSEGSDGRFTGLELGVDTALPPGLPHRYGYHIGGEPRTQEETDEVIRTAAALKEYDPGSFVYVGLNSDATDAMEDQMLSDPNIDGVLGHRYVSDNTSYANLEHNRALGLRHNKPYFRALRSFKSRPELTEPYDLTESDFRFSAFSSLTYGYTGMYWFVYNLEEYHDLDPQLFTATETYQYSSRKSPAFEQTAALNKELFYIGEQTKHLTSTDVRLHLGDDVPYGQPTDTVDWSMGAGGDPYITSIDQFANDDMDVLIGFFNHDDTQNLYFMIQNTLHTHNDNNQVASLIGVVRVEFDFNSVTDLLFDKNNIQKVSRLTGEWENIALTADGSDHYHIDILLTGGSADLFRYSFLNTTGDYNSDGVVDAADFVVWRATLGQSVPKGSGADGNRNGSVDQDDYAIWRSSFGTVEGGKASTAGTAIGEPSAACLALLAVACLVVYRRVGSIGG